MTKLEDLFSPCQSPLSEHGQVDHGQVEEDIKEGENESLFSPLHSMIKKFKAACSSNKEKRRSQFLTYVSHVSLVTVLGLHAGFMPDIPRKVKITSPKIFGVSVECLECSVDSRGNRVPKTLLLLQKVLYARGRLQTEGIFRISAAHSRQKYGRDQVNKGIVPEDVDVHCLAGIITAWFRELPSGILDPLLDHKRATKSQSEEECDRLMRLLPPVEADLFDWAVNLMADVVQEVEQNKMTAHNMATVFTPNMTRTTDPLTVLQHVAQLIKFLETLIIKTMNERGNTDTIASAPVSHRHSLSVPCMEEAPYNLDVGKHDIKLEGGIACQTSDGNGAEMKYSLCQGNKPNDGKKTRKVHSHVPSMQFMPKFL